MKKKVWYIIIPALIFSLIAGITILGVNVDNNEFKFKENVYINGESVRGYSLDKASNKITNKIKQQLKDGSIDFYYLDKSWHFDEENEQVENAVSQVVNKAYNSQTYKTNIDNYNVYKVSFTDVFPNLDNKISEMIKEVEEEPVNSEVTFNPDANPMFEVSASKKGKKVNREKLYEQIENAFLTEKSIKIQLPVEEVNPEKDEDYYKDKLGQMSIFSTDLKNSQSGRRHNVEFALKKFNGKVVKAGETVSFNQVTSPQTLEGGYQKATVILNGVFTEGVGGGICQASTTMYNACVLANMQIEEVHKHTLPVGYVELSLDAMVSDGYADFVFTNTSENDIYIKTYLKDDRAYVEIYGKSIEDGVTITREAEFVGNIPHRGDKIVPDTEKQYTNKVIYKGEYYRLKYPREGYEAKAYKCYYKDGQLIKKEEIRHEKYQPIDGIIIEGVEDLPEGFTLPESDVEFIKPQSQQSANGSNVAKKIKKQNPTRFALNVA